MWRQGLNQLQRRTAAARHASSASSPSLSIWRRKKEMGKEGLMVAKELKRLQCHPPRFERFMKTQVSRLLKSDLVAVLAEFQRQNLVSLSIKLYDVVRRETWYRPDMFFYRDMLMMLSRNKKVDEARMVWRDLKGEDVHFDQHTYGDLIRAFLDNGLPDEAMRIYNEMRGSSDPPLSLPYRVILKGLVPYPELRKKEMGKEGLMVAKELKRLQCHPTRFERFMKTQVSRLLKSDLVAVLAEFQRQNLVSLSIKLYDVVCRETWYRPDMFFYRDMLMMISRNKKVDEARMVWRDLKGEDVHFDQHTYGDLIRAFLDNGLPDEAMRIYNEMRGSSDPPLSLPYRVILKGLVPYPELREKVKDDFLDLFPGMIVYDPPDGILSDDPNWVTDNEED